MPLLKLNSDDDNEIKEIINNNIATSIKTLPPFIIVDFKWLSKEKIGQYWKQNQKSPIERG